MAAASEWRKLPLSLAELCIETTLRCGQSFRWRKIGDEWHCALQGRIVSLKQDSTHLHYRTTWPSKVTVDGPPTPPSSGPEGIVTGPPSDKEGDDDGTAALLQRYFALSHSLTSLYATWSAADINFARRAPAFTGVRILNQDAWETLVAFICSSNNNIGRIAQMVGRLCAQYGTPLGCVAGEAFHDFPPPEALLDAGVEVRLRELGFGYRAKYIAETARLVARERPAGWLCALRNPESSPLDGKATVPSPVEGAERTAEQPCYKAAHEALLQLTGVGPKVADCVCLMGLGWGEAVPVDTHVWQIAQRDYKFGKGGKSKTFNKAMYDAVGNHFRSIWGPQAGWAQSVLFTANLRSFAEQAAAAKAEVTEPGYSLIKVEAAEETVAELTTGRTRKRKTVKAELVVDGDDGESGKAEIKVTRTRTSKRHKTRA